MSQEAELGVFEKLFNSSISKIALGVVIMIWIYSQVIIPLKEQNVQLSEIKLQLADFKNFQTQVSTKNQEQDKRLDSLERK